MTPKILGAQRDFSSGEIDIALKRNDDHPARKTGLRQMSNMRILNSGAIQNRPGRKALFPVNTSARVEEVLMSAGKIFKISFGQTPLSGNILIFDSTGAQVASFTHQGNGANLPWTLDNVDQIVYAQLGLSIYITFTGIHPQVLTWDGVSTWSIADYAELTIGSQKRTPFYRLSPQGITMLPSAQTGAITLLASSAVFTASHPGTRIRFVNRQILIGSVTDSTHANATVLEPLPGSQSINFGSDPTLVFSVGDVVRGSVTGSAGVITSVTHGPDAISIQLISANSSVVNTFDPFVGYASTVFAFTTGDTVVGPGGGLVPTAVTPIQAPRATTYWDDEIMNSMRGFPASCFVDQFRLGFCNFPSVPNGIAWSAINSPNDLYVGANSADAIFELTPDKTQVFFVVPGPESSEFVFTDKKLYYIKIDPANPLKPGSIGFQTLSSDGCARVQPRTSQELILYVNAGGNSMMAIVASGAYYRPFNTKNLCEFAAHLFTDIQAIAVPTADGSFNERYVYVLNASGQLVVGKYTLQNGQVADTVGWAPYPITASLLWVAAFSADVIFTTRYFGITTICEQLDDSKYLDGAVFVNNLPTAFAPGAGQGPLWWIAGQTAALMDQSTRSMGTYQIDGNGFIVPQGNAGEDMTSATLVAGQPWSSIVEPFCPDANPGNDVGQRMFKRRVSRFAAYVVNSTGFLMARLFSGPIRRTSPALGTVMNQLRISAYRQDDDATRPPPLREETQRWRPLGRSFDPRVAIIKDTPGPLQITEIGVECTI